MICNNCGYTIADGSKTCVVCGKQFFSANKKGCVKCGSIIPDGARFCIVCGAKVEPQKPKIICQKCAAPIKDGTNFCNACGAKAGSIATKKICKKCSSYIPDGARFCIVCGERYSEGGNSAPKKPEEKKPANETRIYNTIICKKCGTLCNSNLRFCLLCGASLSGSKAQASAALNKPGKNQPESKYSNFLKIVWNYDTRSACDYIVYVNGENAGEIKSNSVINYKVKDGLLNVLFCPKSKRSKYKQLAVYAKTTKSKQVALSVGVKADEQQSFDVKLHLTGVNGLENVTEKWFDSDSTCNMVCEQCGAKLENNAKFCNICGSMAINLNDIIICRTCGAECTRFVEFCRECGTSIGNFNNNAIDLSSEYF